MLDRFVGAADIAQINGHGIASCWTSGSANRETRNCSHSATMASAAATGRAGAGSVDFGSLRIGPLIRGRAGSGLLMVNDNQSIEGVDPPFTTSNCRSALPYQSFSLWGPFSSRVLRGAPMSRIGICAFVSLILSAMAPAPASASLNCLGDHKPFKMASDTIQYSMTIAPGADCIQGLRWSTMQIYAVWVLEKPKNGKLEMVGPGFRYFAKSNFSGTDKFSLVVVGKNLREEGYSTVEITVAPRDPSVAPSLVSRADIRDRAIR